MAVERYEKKKNAQLTKAQREIDAIFKVAAQEAAAIAGTIRKPNPDKPFSFQDYPQTRARIAKLEEWMAEEIAQSISNNVDKEWEIAEESGQELTSDFLRSTYEDVSNAPAALQARYFRNNTEAHDAFLARTIGGMGLSERVWRLTAQCRQEMEMAIDIGLGEGQSAQEMSRSIRKYLKEPDKLFRRVRDKHGNLVLSKAALAYHPGQGVYRSSYKNALRLTVTEGNMAYRTADHLKWQQLDFVVGIKIGLSNNHTLNGVPFHDICDELAGRYPKDFKFTGWHPFCRCIATTILMTPEEFKANEEAFLDGKEPAVRSKNEVDDVPPQFKKWRKENAKKIKSAKSLPYFVRDNEQYFKRGKITRSAAKGVKESRALNDALQQVTDPAVLREQARQAVLAAAKARQANRTPEEVAAIKARWEQRAAERRKAAILENARLRHEARTPEVVANIKDRWEEHKQRHLRIKKRANNVLKVAREYSDVYPLRLMTLVKKGDLTGMQAETKALAAQILAVKKQEAALADLIPNVHDLHKTFSINELQDAYKELDGVMKKWLLKYDYPSVGAAPLDHLRNKLSFELATPSIKYAHKEIIEKALNEQIRLVNQKIEWKELVARADALKAFKTKSSIFKGYVSQIDDAIQHNDFGALKSNLAKAETQRQKLLEQQIKRGGDTKGALNQEYKGGVVGKDLTASVDVKNMTTTDYYEGHKRYTNNVARLQGFDAPAKLVSTEEFNNLHKAYGDVFFRTVTPTEFDGKMMSASEFAQQMYKADKMNMNGPSGRVYGDGIYVTTSAWNGRHNIPLSNSSMKLAFKDSAAYGRFREHETLAMTWTRTPKIIKQTDLKDMWNKLSNAQKAKFGNHENTYACALGYDGMYCNGPNYMVIWNRSIIAVKQK